MYDRQLDLIFMHARSYHYNINSIYKLYKIEETEKIQVELQIKSEDTFLFDMNTYGIKHNIDPTLTPFYFPLTPTPETLDPITQVNPYYTSPTTETLDPIPTPESENSKAQTLPWYSIITIIIFIIVILLCIVYRESLRSWSNLATLDPRNFGNS